MVAELGTIISQPNDHILDALDVLEKTSHGWGVIPVVFQNFLIIPKPQILHGRYERDKLAC